jgi:hypothetical protein
MRAGTKARPPTNGSEPYHDSVRAGREEAPSPLAKPEHGDTHSWLDPQPRGESRLGHLQ